MANPLVRLGVKAAVKGGKKLAKKIKTARNSRNSTDNMTKGPIDKQIGKTRANQKGITDADMMPDINPNEYGYGTGGAYQAPPKKSRVRDIMKAARKLKNKIDIDDPF
jgi:hypothetical protein|tara:strand:+ start:4424 stop:4747 length:324 start_codon:yes stop_codon:yes gene_type:complete